MSADLIAITDEQRTPTAREHRVKVRLREAHDALSAEIDQYEDSATLRTLLTEYWYAYCKTDTHWEGRVRKLERALNTVMGTDITEAQRESMLTTMYGERDGRRRNIHLLSEHERSLIDQYREMDAEARLMLRTLFQRLAATSTKGGA